MAAAPCWADCLTGDGSKLYTSYVCSANRINTDHAKPLQTLAFVGVSQTRNGDTNHDTTATATATPRGATATARRPRPRHDGHGHDGHDVATIAYKGTCPRDTTRHAKTQSHKRSNVAPCNKHPRGGASRPVPLLGPVGQ